MTADPLLFQQQGEARLTRMFEASSEAVRAIHKKTASIRAMLDQGALIFVICGSSSGCLGLGAILETANLGLDLGDAFLRFGDLAVDSIQFTQQLLSAIIQAFHYGGPCKYLKPARLSWALLHALSARFKQNFSDPLTNKSQPRRNG
jgi:hypothetical protein